jgi:hypothetical protein
LHNAIGMNPSKRHKEKHTDIVYSYRSTTSPYLLLILDSRSCTMSFGFSIGDFISIAQLAWNTYTALRDASEDFQGFASEVHSLHTALVCLRDEAISPSSILQYAAPQKIAGLKDVMKNCERGLLDLQKLVPTVLCLQPGKRGEFWAKFRLAFKDKQGPRDKLAIHTASINIFLSSLTHNSLGRLELLLAQVLRTSSESVSTSAETSRGPGTELGNTWNETGQDLLIEGMGETHFRQFKDEIKAYMRYLVHGGHPLSKTNFRLRDPDQYTRKAGQRFHEEQDRPPKLYLERPEKRYTSHSEYAGNYGKVETITVRRTQTLEEKNRIPARRMQALKEAEDVDVDDLVDRFDQLFSINEDSMVAESVSLEPFISRLEVPEPNSSKPGSDRGGNTNQVPSPAPRPQGQVESRASAIQSEKRSKAIEETRTRLIKYERRKEEADRAGNQAKAADIRDNIIPDIRRRLENLNSSSRRTSCDACLGPIVERYSHCAICQGGNYDLCKSCVDSGVKCEGKHPLQTMLWTP